MDWNEIQEGDSLIYGRIRGMVISQKLLTIYLHKQSENVTRVTEKCDSCDRVEDFLKILVMYVIQRGETI